MFQKARAPSLSSSQEVSLSGSPLMSHILPKTSKVWLVGSARLRKTLFQIMTTLLQNAPEDDPVYRFLDKKRS